MPENRRRPHRDAASDYRLWDEIRYLTMMWERLQVSAANASGISLIRYLLLLEVAGAPQGAASRSHLQARLGIDDATLDRLLDSMIVQGFLGEGEAPPGEVLLRLTAEGQAAIERMVTELSPWVGTFAPPVMAALAQLFGETALEA